MLITKNSQYKLRVLFLRIIFKTMSIYDDMVWWLRFELLKENQWSQIQIESG